MIQRYKTTTKLRPHDCEIVSIAVPDDGGDYVLYDDHMQVLESIGAGGVGGRITNKSIEEHRAEFEDATFKSDVDALQDIFDTFRPHSTRLGENGKYRDEWMEHRWQSWCLAKGIKLWG